MGNMVVTDFLSIYSGKRVMITGHTGFKGSWLSFLLRELGADVLGYALPPVQEQNHFDMLKLSTLIQHIEGDVRDENKLASTMEAFQPDFVFHLAAQALVHTSYTEPKVTFETNVMGSVNLLEAVRKCDSVRSLVYITSDKCYKNKEWIWGYRENDVLGGHDPYSASKASAEMVFSAYKLSFFHERPELGAASTRAGNVIGGGDWSENRIIPDCIRACESDTPIFIRSPNATRPWQHVLEPLSGYLMLAARLYDEPKEFSGSWNFGPPSSQVRTVLEVATHLVDRLEKGSISSDQNAKKYHEAQLLQLNCDKAHQRLGWYPKWDVEHTLNMTADWYKEISLGKDARNVTREQLQEYFPELANR